MKKGFTLIELLAVILILGIVSLIAVPKVTDVIEDSKKGAAETSAKNYIDAVDGVVGISLLKENPITDGTKNVGDIEVKIKGELPSAGTIVIERGSVKSADLIVNGYHITCDNMGKCSVAE